MAVACASRQPWKSLTPGGAAAAAAPAGRCRMRRHVAQASRTMPPPPPHLHVRENTMRPRTERTPGALRPARLRPPLPAHSARLCAVGDHARELRLCNACSKAERDAVMQVRADARRGLARAVSRPGEQAARREIEPLEPGQRGSGGTSGHARRIATGALIDQGLEPSTLRRAISRTGCPRRVAPR